MASQEIWEPMSATLPPLPDGGSDSDGSADHTPQTHQQASVGRSQPARRSRQGRPRRFLTKRRGWAFIPQGGSLERRLKRLLVPKVDEIVEMEVRGSPTRTQVQGGTSAGDTPTFLRPLDPAILRILQSHAGHDDTQPEVQTSDAREVNSQAGDGNAEPDFPVFMSQTSEGMDFLLRAAGESQDLSQRGLDSVMDESETFT